MISVHSQTSYGQNKIVRYPPVQLKEDLDYLKHLITAAHANPYSELSPQRFDNLFATIRASLKDSSTATEFLKKIKPIIAYLCDEHAQINLKPDLLTTAYSSQAIYPPFTLVGFGKGYNIDDCLRDSNLKGLSVKRINGVRVSDLVQRCALATTGFLAQREENALRQFAYLYPWISNNTGTQFTVETTNGKTLVMSGITLKEWDIFLAARSGVASCDERLSYRKIGNIGYINACSFDLKPKGKYSYDSIKVKIDTIFKRINKDGVTKLVIDVSRNEGGNSLVGDYLISNISDKP